MYTFIETPSSDTPVSLDEISRLEQIFKVKIPGVLLEYWLKCNGSEIRPCKFRVRTGRFVRVFCVTDILTVGCVKYDFVYYQESIKRNPNIPNTFVAFALDEAGNEYCWDQTDGRIYYTGHEEEAPVAVCESMETFFQLLSDGNEIAASAKKTKETISKKSATNQVGWEAEALRFHEKPVMLMVWLCAALLSLVLIPFTDGLSVILTGVLGLWTIIFLCIWISHMISTHSAIERYGKENLIRELTAPGTKLLEGTNTYLTENYIISNRRRVTVIKYSDISWIYSAASFWADIGAERFQIQAWLKSGKLVVCGQAKTKNQIGSICDRVARKNKELLVGYTQENKKKYKESSPGYRKRRVLTWMLIAVPVVAAVIYRLFFFVN